MKKYFVFPNGKVLGDFKFKDLCSPDKNPPQVRIAYRRGFDGVYISRKSGKLQANPPVRFSMMRSGIASRIPRGWEIIGKFLRQSELQGKVRWLESKTDELDYYDYENGKWNGNIEKVHNKVMNFFSHFLPRLLVMKQMLFLHPRLVKKVSLKWPIVCIQLNM